MKRYLVTCFPAHPKRGLRRTFGSKFVAVSWWLRLLIGGYTTKVVDQQTYYRIDGSEL